MLDIPAERCGPAFPRAETETDRRLVMPSDQHECAEREKHHNFGLELSQDIRTNLSLVVLVVRAKLSHRIIPLP